MKSFPTKHTSPETRLRAWRDTDLGKEKYRVARAHAQQRANETGIDMGLEANDLIAEWHVFYLPAKQHRSGRELRCEVVMCERLSKCLPGHGPTAKQPEEDTLNRTDRRSAVAGEAFYVTTSHLQRPLGVKDAFTPVTVKAKTKGDQGQWLCIACSAVLESQTQKDAHCEESVKKSALVKPDKKPVHVLAWRSFISGDVEAP